MLFVVIFFLLALLSIRGVIKSPGLIEFESSQILRGMLVLLVLFHHLPPLENPIAHFVQSYSGRYAVALFFFLSGYGLMLQCQNKRDTFFSTFFKRRYTKLLLPYILFYIVYIILKGEYSLSLCVKNFMTGENVVPFAYFVEELVILYLLFYFIFKKVDAFRGVIYLFIATFFLMGVLYCTAWKEHWWVSSLGFPMGALVCFYRDKLCRINLVSCSLLILSCVALVLARYSDILAIRVACFSFITCPAVCLAVSMLLPMVKWTACKCSILLYIGSISYELYLVQGIVLKMNYPWNEEWYSVFFVCLAVAFASLAHYFITRIGTRLEKALNRIS